MFRKLTFTVWLLLTVWIAVAQPALRGVNPDSLTWQLYQQQRWDELLKTGRQLNRQGIDYYYLRMRMAVAALETHRYDDAAGYLRRAMDFSPRDLQARRLMVLARNYNLMPAEAGRVFARLPKNMQNDLGLKPGFRLLSVHADAGFSQSNLSLSDKFEELAGEAGFYGSQSGLSQSGLLDAGAWMQLRPGWLLYGGYQHMSYNFGQNFAYLKPELKLDRVEINGNYKDFYYRIDSKQNLLDARINTTQRSLYVQSRHALNANLQLVVAAGFSRVQGTFPLIIADTVRFTDTARLDMISGVATLFGVDVPVAKVRYKNWRTTDYRAVFGAIGHFGRFSPEVGAHIGRVNDTSLLQLQAGYTWRLRGNAKTWQQAEVFVLGDGKGWRPALKVAAGHWLGTSTQLSASVIAGHLNGMSDQWGYVIFNHRDRLDLFGEGVLTQKITRGLFLNLRYRYNKSVSKVEQLDENLELKVSYKDLISHGFIGGLIWIL